MYKPIYSRQHDIFLLLLRRSRESVRLRQLDLATLLGRDQTMVSRVERGSRKLDIIELRAWLRALDVNFVDFMLELDVSLAAHTSIDPRLTSASKTGPSRVHFVGGRRRGR